MSYPQKRLNQAVSARFVPRLRTVLIARLDKGRLVRLDRQAHKGRKARQARRSWPPVSSTPRG